MFSFDMNEEDEALAPFIADENQVTSFDRDSATIVVESQTNEHEPLLFSVESKASREIEQSAKANLVGSSLSERLGNFIAAYDTISFTTSFVFTFAVSMASDHSVKNEFRNQNYMFVFHILLTLCIGCALYTLLILSWINYNANRHLGYGVANKSAHYLEETYYIRSLARKSFVVSLITFVLALAALYIDGLPIILASIQSIILIIAIVAVLISINHSQSKVTKQKTRRKSQNLTKRLFKENTLTP